MNDDMHSICQVCTLLRSKTGVSVSCAAKCKAPSITICQPCWLDCNFHTNRQILERMHATNLLHGQAFW